MRDGRRVTVECERDAAEARRPSGNAQRSLRSHWSSRLDSVEALEDDVTLVRPLGLGRLELEVAERGANVLDRNARLVGRNGLERAVRDRHRRGERGHGLLQMSAKVLRPFQAASKGPDATWCDRRCD